MDKDCRVSERHPRPPSSVLLIPASQAIWSAIANRRTWVTEGPLKAIVVQDWLRHTALGVPGVSAWQEGFLLMRR